MKYLFIFLTIFNGAAFANLNADIEFTAGTAEVEGDSTNSFTGKIGLYQNNIYQGFGAGGGLRITRFSANDYQPSSKRSESLENVQIDIINIFGQVHYQMNNYRFGFNLDLGGSTSGPAVDIAGSSQNVDIISSNQFRGGENDIGSLNSQIFASYYFGRTFISAGIAHTVVEFDDEGLSGDDRRQRFFDSIFIGFGGSYN